MKRRPNASDRDLAEWIYSRASGSYRIDITTDHNPTHEPYCGLARLKREGSLVIDDNYKLIEIYPIQG